MWPSLQPWSVPSFADAKGIPLKRYIWTEQPGVIFSVNTGQDPITCLKPIAGSEERTGIAVDGILTSQLLINIFEKNTPLHDGAVIVRGDRVVSATCYLPLTDSLSISKDLGTRHRAAVGISEVSDSLTIVVSEETGKVSIAMGGELYRNVDAEFLKNKLSFIQHREKKVSKIELWRRRLKDVKESGKKTNE